MSARHPRRGDACYRRDARKNVQAEYRAKLCLSYVEAKPFFEAKPQRSLVKFLEDGNTRIHEYKSFARA